MTSTCCLRAYTFIQIFERRGLIFAKLITIIAPL